MPVENVLPSDGNRLDTPLSRPIVARRTVSRHGKQRGVGNFPTLPGFPIALVRRIIQAFEDFAVSPERAAGPCFAVSLLEVTADFNSVGQSAVGFLKAFLVEVSTARWLRNVPVRPFVGTEPLLASLP